MAAIADFVDAGGFQQGCGGAAMRVVTVGAAELSFQKRHMRAAREFRMLLLVTGKTGLVHRGLSGQASG